MSNNITDIFNIKLKSELKANQRHYHNFNAIYEFRIGEKNPEIWSLKFDSGHFELKHGLFDHADCIIIIDNEQFIKMSDGKLNTKLAFLTRKLKIKGDIGLALKLESILKSINTDEPTSLKNSDKLTIEKKLTFEDPPEKTVQKHFLFSELEENNYPIVLPGVYDALSARIAQQAGFKAVVFSGYAATASIMAKPDFGLLTQTEIINSARYISNAVDISLIVDCDTGYGGPVNVIRTVEEIEKTGASGMILEDQQWPKRCGHMVGKKVIDIEEYEQKLLAALESRKKPDSFSVTARTDALGPLGIDEAIKRANRYHELGASAVFVEAPQNKEELQIIRQNVPGPLVANMIEGGLSPLLSLDEFAQIGYQFVGYPLSGIFAASHALKNVFTNLKKYGSTVDMASQMDQFDEFVQIVELEKTYKLEQKYSF